LRPPCRIHILLLSVLMAGRSNRLAFVPHAKDIHVAAILDTILARWRDFSDIVAGGSGWKFVKGGRFHFLIIAKRRISGRSSDQRVFVVKISRRHGGERDDGRR
jgi:hypothetical protein